MSRRPPYITVYLTEEEQLHIRKQAAKLHATVSKYARDVIMGSHSVKDQQIIQLERELGSLQADIHTAISMIDKTARCSSTPEDYEAWKAQVEADISRGKH